MSTNELLFAAFSPIRDNELTNRIKGLAAAIEDWHSVLAAGTAVRALPILHERLEAWAPEDVPGPVREQLRSAHMANAARNVRLAHQLDFVLTHLQQAGIPALTFKGVSLAHLAYSDPSLRVFDDLDIIVPPEDLSRAHGIVESLGYQEIMELPGAISRARHRRLQSRILRHHDGSHEVDLGCALLHDYFSCRLPRDAIWRNPYKINIAGHSLRCLRLEPLFLYLCAHGAKHLWSRPTWSADIAGLLLRQADTIRWKEVWRLACMVDGERMIQLGTTLAEATYGAPVPTELADYLQPDGRDIELSEEIRKRQRERFGQPDVDDFARVRIHLALRNRLRSRIRYLWIRGITPSPNDWRARPLPTWLSPLYIPLRIARLALRHLSPLKIMKAVKG
jgi:hypothetical protein